MPGSHEARRFVHLVDRNDQIVFANDDWFAFAAENGASELNSETVIGRSLWQFVAGEETRQLSELILAKARTTRRPLTIEFRCDGPQTRRFMEMVLLPLANGAIEFRNRILREEPRESAVLVHSPENGSDKFLSICSWCKRVAVSPLQWLEIDEALATLDLFVSTLPPRLTHGICDHCMTEIEEKLK